MDAIDLLRELIFLQLQSVDLVSQLLCLGTRSCDKLCLEVCDLELPLIVVGDEALLSVLLDLILLLLIQFFDLSIEIIFGLG